MGSQDASPPLEVPKIDFSGLRPGTDAWDAARAEVMTALHAWGCFQVVDDRYTPKLSAALFGSAVDELFSLPLETKLKNITDLPGHGYFGGIPGMSYESLTVDGAPSREDAERFTRLMWPDGNPTFCNTVWTFAKLLKDLEQMAQRMIMQGLGIEKHYDSHMASIKYGLRLSHYGIPLDQEAKIAMPPHKDMNLLTIVCQHQVGGLEVQASNGKWVQVVPSSNSFTIIVGEALQAWTNGRFKAALHRVRIETNESRYSTLFVSGPKDVVRTPEELIDEEHPLLFKAYDFCAYLRFRFSEEGKKAENALIAYCGAAQEEVKAQENS